MRGPQVNLALDRRASLLRIDLVGEVTDDLLVERACRLMDASPETSGYDSLLDFRDYDHTVTLEGAARFAREYQRRFGPFAAHLRYRTAVVCSQPLYSIVLKLFSIHFPDRHFRLVREMREAESWLIFPRPGTLG